MDRVGQWWHDDDTQWRRTKVLRFEGARVLGIDRDAFEKRFCFLGVHGDFDLI